MRRLAHSGLALMVIVLAGAGRAAEVEIGWVGTVGSVDAALAAALPPDSCIAVGATAWGSYVFESTTPDSDPDPGVGSYPSSLVAWTTLVGKYAFEHSGSGTNQIEIFLDMSLTTYEPIDGIVATPALPGPLGLEADVFFLDLQASALPDDALPLSPLDPASWDVANAGIFDAAGPILIDIELSQTCSGRCPGMPGGADTDSDGDGVCDSLDNCVFRANPGQDDGGNVGPSGAPMPDGIGDVCQCGDLTGNTFVDFFDVVGIRFYSIETSTPSAADLERCSAIGPPDSCDPEDQVVIARVSELTPLGPGVTQGCRAAVGP